MKPTVKLFWYKLTKGEDKWWHVILAKTLEDATYTAKTIFTGYTYNLERVEN